MRAEPWFVGAAALLVGAATACGNTDRPHTGMTSIVDTTALTMSAGGNILSGCVASFDSTRDYFPEKSQAVSAKQFTVEYHRNFKILTVTPREDTTLRIRYALVQCGTPAPSGFDARRVIEVPVRRMAITHTDYHGVIDTLNLYSQVLAISQEKVVSLPRMRAALAQGTMRAVGSQHHLDLEQLIALKPDVILSYWSVSPEWNAPAKVDEVGLKSGALVGHWERTPLGALDWLKVVAMYVNREGDANAIVAGVSARYDSLRARVQQNAGRDSVHYITAFPAGDNWELQRADHSAYTRMQDAGLVYAFRPLIDESDFPSTTLEAAIVHGSAADVWFGAPARWKSTADIIATDARLSAFRAVGRGQVYSWRRGASESDRVPYSERWLAHPDEVLGDIIAATHPALLPGHTFHYLQRVPAAPSAR